MFKVSRNNSVVLGVPTIRSMWVVFYLAGAFAHPSMDGLSTPFFPALWGGFYMPVFLPKSEAVSVAKVTAEEAKNPLFKYVDIPAITDQFQAIRLEVWESDRRKHGNQLHRSA